MKYTTLIIICFLSFVTFGQQLDKPEEVSDSQWLMAQTIVQYEKDLPEKIKEAKKDIFLLKRARFVNRSSKETHKFIDGRYIFYKKHADGSRRDYESLKNKQNSLIEKQERILNTLEEDYKSFRKGDMAVPTFPLYKTAIKVGQIGCFITNHMHNGKNFGDEPVVTQSKEVYFEILQITGDKEAIGYAGAQEILIRITGYDFSNLIDGKKLWIDGFFHISQTYRYETVVGGSKTIFQFDYIEKKDMNKLVNMLKESQK